MYNRYLNDIVFVHSIKHSILAKSSIILIYFLRIKKKLTERTGRRGPVSNVPKSAKLKPEYVSMFEFDCGDSSHSLIQNHLEKNLFIIKFYQVK